MTGTRKDRPKLEELHKTLRKGDMVVVYKLDRISRSTKHLIELTEVFMEKGVDFVSIQAGICHSRPIFCPSRLGVNGLNNSAHSLRKH